MRNTLITIAAWTAAIAIVFWQRFLWPGIKAFLPGIEDLFSEPGSDETPAAARTSSSQAPTSVRTSDVQEPAAAVETLVIERCKPAAPRRSSRKQPAQTAGFAL